MTELSFDPEYMVESSDVNATHVTANYTSIKVNDIVVNNN
jgi:hypothetical protein